VKSKIRTWLLRLIPVLFIIISIAIMTTGNILKQPIGKDDQLVAAIKKLEANIEDKNWEGANENIDYAKKAWHKIANRIQLSVEREYVIEINGILDRIKGGVKAKDDQAITEEIYYFYGLWKYLGK
jgi:hypothetical protein